ncbi:PAS domain-containing protein [Candidatus Sumerlaeota bacterium]|nr:PAS domain-containing protein [Candidatus Sumerlaeota bacterium]
MKIIGRNKEVLGLELERVREQNRRLTDLIENSKDVLFRMSLPEGRYEYINSASADVFGYAPEEFYQSPLLIRKIIHPGWKEYFEQKWPQLLSGDMPLFYEFQIIHKSGDTRWIYQKNVLVRDKNGAPIAIEGIVSDITERKKIEAALRMSEAGLLEAQRMAHIGNWYWDVKTGEVEWSEEVFHIFHLDPKEFKPQIDSILSLSPWPDDHQRGEELIHKAVESREKGSYEQKFLFPDGGTGYYFSTFQGIYDDDGKLIAIRGTVQDITGRKQAEKEKAFLEEQYRQVQKVESIGRLAGGVAHDLNNLLTPVLGYGEMLIDEFAPNDTRRDMVSEILTCGIRAKNLVGQLLAFSRKQTLEYKTLDMNQVIKGIKKLLRHTIRENIKLELVPSTAPLTIRADLGQIEQVILNLAVNAQDAMPDGGILTIESGLVRHDEQYIEDHYATTVGDYVMLAISDSGCGMDASTREQIFEPFFSTKGELGTGLGLATVYGIVKQHGGNIFVYSELGRGTTFKIYIPYYQEEHVEIIPVKKKGRKRRGSETILLTEDNQHVRRLTQAVLQKYGYHVIEAENGEKALEALAAHNGPVHLLLTDVILPGINGRELFERAARQRSGLKVIYFSGYTDNVIAHHGILDEGIHFIQKPFSSEVLTSKIREALDGHDRTV